MKEFPFKEPEERCILKAMRIFYFIKVIRKKHRRQFSECLHRIMQFNKLLVNSEVGY